MAKIPDLLWGSLVGLWVSFFLLRKLCDFLTRCLASRQNEMMWNKSMKQSHMLENTLYLCKSVIINFSLMPRPHNFSEWGLGMKLINFDPCKKKKKLFYILLPLVPSTVYRMCQRVNLATGSWSSIMQPVSRNSSQPSRNHGKLSLKLLFQLIMTSTLHWYWNHSSLIHVNCMYSNIKIFFGTVMWCCNIILSGR